MILRLLSLPWRALEEACKELGGNDVTEAERDELVVESDTEGEAGQPPIMDTILAKIDAAAVVVADMTFTGTRLDGRPTPNANVLIEYGWALKSLGHRRVVTIMNEAFGKATRESLPFDLSHMRFPVRFTLPENATAAERTQIKRKLVGTLKLAIGTSLATVPTPTVEPPPGFPQAAIKNGPARFRSKGEAIGIEDGLLSDEPKEIFLADGPAMWLRLMPETPLEKEWLTYDMKQLLLQGNALTLVPMILGSGWNPLRAEDGIGVYENGISRTNAPNSLEVDDVAFAFKTGEIWSIDTGLLSSDETRVPFVESYYVQRIKNYAQFLQLLGAQPPYRWIAGLTGVQKRGLSRPDTQTQRFINSKLICLSDTIEAQGAYDGKEDAVEALMPFFRKIFEAGGVPRPNY